MRLRHVDSFATFGRSASVLLLFGVATILPKIVNSQENSDKGEVDATILGFIELNSFCDRGIAQSPFGLLPDADPTEDERLAGLMVAVDETAAYVSTLSNEIKLVKRQPLDWPWLQRRSQADLTKEIMLRSSVVRFCRHGLIELFRPEFRGLLDTPLEARPVLVTQLQAIVDEASKHYLYLSFNKVVKRNELLLVAGNLRRLSLDFDRSIFEALDTGERIQVAALIEMTSPVWLQIDVLEGASHPQPFGSQNLARLRNSNSTKSR